MWASSESSCLRLELQNVELFLTTQKGLPTMLHPGITVEQQEPRVCLKLNWPIGGNIDHNMFPTPSTLSSICQSEDVWPVYQVSEYRRHASYSLLCRKEIQQHIHFVCINKQFKFISAIVFPSFADLEHSWNTYIKTSQPFHEYKWLPSNIPS